MSAPRNPPDDPSPDDERNNRNNPRRGGADKPPFSKPAHGAQDAGHGEKQSESNKTLRDQLIEASLSTHVAPVAWSIGRDRIGTIREWLAWQEILCSHPELDL